jgi:hypothetical protein
MQVREAAIGAGVVLATDHTAITINHGKTEKKWPAWHSAFALSR